MAKSRSARKRKGVARIHRMSPTDEQMRQAEFVSAGMAYRRTPVIDSMLSREQITRQEHAALAHYRDQAHLAERTAVKSCLDVGPSSGGNGTQLPAAVVSAMLTTARIERDLGSLLPIVRAIAVEDKSLSQWCVEKFGGRERYNGKGEFIAIVPVSEKRHMELATLELRMGARRIVA